MTQKKWKSHVPSQINRLNYVYSVMYFRETGLTCPSFHLPSPPLRLQDCLSTCSSPPPAGSLIPQSAGGHFRHKKRRWSPGGGSLSPHPRRDNRITVCTAGLFIYFFTHSYFFSSFHRSFLFFRGVTRTPTKHCL